MAKGKKLSPRHLAREWSVQFLYQLDLRDSEFSEDDIELFWEQLTEGPSSPSKYEAQKGKEFADQIIRGVVAGKPEMDAAIVKYAENWSLHRMSVVDRNILRVGVYELLKTDLAAEVIINEALEIAKVFSDIDSPSFINAVLDQVNKGR
jgi:transcription antitermination protein NusB